MSTNKEVTLQQKIGQMLIVGFEGATLNSKDSIVEALLANLVGGVILFDYHYPSKTYNHNIQNPAQLSALTSQLQQYAKAPLLIGIDYEGGLVNRLKDRYGFPKTLSPAEISQLSDEDIQKNAELMAQTLQQGGINLNFAPSLDVNVNPDCPIIGKLGRSYSKDPNKVVYCANIVAQAYRDHGVIPVFKHFPGHGSAVGDTHLGFVDVSDTWKIIELDPYKALLTSDVDVVMTAHVVHYGLDEKGYPASLSFAMTNQLLRNQLNFQGLVITDDMQMKAIADNYGLEDAICLAINAGADMLVFGNQLAPVPQTPKELIDIISKNVATGRISESRINEAYQRIIKLKSTLVK